jgi:hypothetical protein
MSLARIAVPSSSSLATSFTSGEEPELQPSPAKLRRVTPDSRATSSISCVTSSYGNSSRPYAEFQRPGGGNVLARRDQVNREL